VLKIFYFKDKNIVSRQRVFYNNDIGGHGKVMFI